MRGKIKGREKNGYIMLLVLLVSVALGALYTAYSFEPLLSKKTSVATSTTPDNQPEAARVYQSSGLEGIDAATKLKAQLENRNKNIQDQ